MFLDSKGIDTSKVEYFEEIFKTMCPGMPIEEGMTVQTCSLVPDRRIIKTHLPLSLLPPDLLDKPKVSKKLTYLLYVADLGTVLPTAGEFS